MLVGAFLSVASGVSAAALYMPQDSVSLERNRKLHGLLRWLDQQHGTIISMQRDLVACRALNPEHGGDGEERKLLWVESRLRNNGITSFERLDFADPRVPGMVRGNLIARIPGKPDENAFRPTLWLISHLDVFPPGPLEDWTGDPFTLRVEGDLIFGRGAEDNNQAIVTSLLLVEALRETGIVPPIDVGLVFCSGALTNYHTNIGYIVERRPDLFSVDDLILIMDYGNEDGSFIEVAEKGNAWLKFTVTGREGHASSPHEAANAFAAGTEFIHLLRGLEKQFPIQNPLFSPPGCTFTPTVAEGRGKTVNHIPGEFIFYVDARLTPEYSFADMEHAIRNLADSVAREEGVAIEYEIIEQTAAAGVTPADSAVVRLVANAVRKQLGVTVTAGGIGGVTMASVLRARGYPVAVWGIQTNWRNKAEERASISSHVDQAKVLARLLLDAESLPSRLQDETLGEDEAADPGSRSR
ncbi:MAG: M20 family metallo-hydrolase [Planctomycetes bacterium]|nr:M20 family metallo-hydrolase [Planctomycetota bacterium]